jgi:protein-L-isoaspartate O-methyltransferase
MISFPHSYPRFYEPLGLGEVHRFLEVGVGSGYGTSLAREVVGPAGLVVAIEIDATTLAFARETYGGRATPTWCSFTATGDSGTASTPRTIGSASRRPAPTSRRRWWSSSHRVAG